MATIAKRIYVISDLHIGGRYPAGVEPATGTWPDRNDRGFRICTHVPELAAFVASLADEDDGGGEVELVINGDFVDFLAEEWDGPERWKAFIEDEAAAAARLDEIVERDRALFDALASFLAKGHRLTILLGNHDVELSFPRVRQRLERAVGAGAGTRFQFIYDGEAYVVGDAIIEHGNRYDGFNVIDHDGLRRVRSSQSRRQTVHKRHDFRRPPGSKMVAEVMNHLKARFPFVDLLKPEDSAAVPIVLALAPAAYSILARLDLTKEATKYALQARQRQLGGVQPSWAGDISATGGGAASGDDDDDEFGDDMGAGSWRPDGGAAGDAGGAGGGDAAAELDDGLQAILADQLGADAARAFGAEIVRAAPTGDGDGEAGSAGSGASSGAAQDAGGGPDDFDADGDDDDDDDLADDLDTAGDISAVSFAGRVAASVAGKAIDKVAGYVDAGNRVLSVGRLLLAQESRPLHERIEVLYAAIKAVQDDRSFDRSVEVKSEYRDAAQDLLDRGFKVVVFGHTHLAKRVELSGGVYLNSGTWADLMRFPTEILHEPFDAAKRSLLDFCEALAQRRLTPYVEFHPTYVRLDLDADDRVVTAELCDYQPA